jgi:hypothetical protein
MSTACRPGSLKTLFHATVLISGLFCACGGGAPDFPEDNPDSSPTHNWQSTTVAQVEENGSTVPFVVARQAPNGNIHIAYYRAVIESEDVQYQQLNYLVWNPGNHSLAGDIVENRAAPSGVNGFDQCDQFDFALDASGQPIFIYPTYEINTYLQQKEADIMINLREAGTWFETTGAVGFVNRNPVYQDGHVADSMAMAVDGQGNIHLCYQYYTEGMDSANYRYPDLYYAKRDRVTIHDPIPDIQGYAAIEELVDGNAFSTYGVHNSIGYFCKLILDDNDLPYIVYAEHGENFMGTYALKVAFKDESGQWHRQVIESLDDGWEIGGISAAFYPVDPENPEARRPLAVAYALRSPSPGPDDAHRLKFANNQSGAWTTEIVDESTWCGTHCALAFNPDGNPAVAYFDEQSHSGRIHQFLKYAEFNGLMWVKESAEEQGSAGRYNTLWFDAQGVPNICTFSDELNEIQIIRQTN